MNLFRDLERAIDEKLRGLFRGEGNPDQRKELVEIQRAILEDVVDHAQLLPRARRALTANDIVFRLPVTDEERRAAFQLVFVESNALEAEIKQYLRQEQIEFPNDLTITVELLDHDVPAVSSAKGFVSVYSKREKLAAPAVSTVASARTVRLTPLSPGTPPGEFSKTRIQIGRAAEVLDDRRRLVRRNDWVLDEHTVSRAHAHIEFDAQVGGYRLFDDGSSHGTSVLHEGRLVEVPKAGGRGQRLTSGDEIYFGQVRVQFEVL